MVMVNEDLNVPCRVMVHDAAVLHGPNQNLYLTYHGKLVTVKTSTKINFGGFLVSFVVVEVYQLKCNNQSQKAQYLKRIGRESKCKRERERDRTKTDR